MSTNRSSKTCPLINLSCNQYKINYRITMYWLPDKPLYNTYWSGNQFSNNWYTKCPSAKRSDRTADRGTTELFYKWVVPWSVCYGTFWRSLVWIPWKFTIWSRDTTPRVCYMSWLMHPLNFVWPRIDCKVWWLVVKNVNTTKLVKIENKNWTC